MLIDSPSRSDVVGCGRIWGDICACGNVCATVVNGS